MRRSLPDPTPRAISPGVIIIGGHTQALSLARIFGRDEIPVFLVYDKSLNISRFSRYVKKFFKAPKGTTSYLMGEAEERELISFLMGLPKYLDGSMVLPTNDPVSYVVSKHKDELSKRFKIPVPDLDVFVNAYNKDKSIDICKSMGIPIPSTVFESQINQISPDSIAYPALIRGTVGHIFYKRAGKKVILVNDEHDLQDKWVYITKIIDKKYLMIQEVVSTKTEDIYSFGSYSRNGEVIGFWIGHKLREHPEVFGTANAFISKYEPLVEEYGRRFINGIKYTGISEIEFVYDTKYKNFRFIEMNARPWLQVGLANRCGANLPMLLFKDINGEKIQGIGEFREGIIWVHFWPDFAMALKGILLNKLNIWDYISTFRGENEFCVMDKEDILPFVAETLLLPYLWIKLWIIRW